MKTHKSYSDCMQEISKEELLEGLLGYGMFDKKMPPFLTSEPFFDFCQKTKNKSIFEQTEHGFIQYENMRNINIPRILAIPNPIAYRNLCTELHDNWEKLQSYFELKTKEQKFKVSRIHIRKIETSKVIFAGGYDDDYEIEYKKYLFEMSHKNFYTDDQPEPDLLIGKNFIVKADISNCFPSIYTHSISWALAGKKESKENRDNQSKWFNQIDRCTRNLKNAETNGILIGNHASNLISEIILVAIDAELHKKYKYLRRIDDYTFYAKNHDEAQNFLIDLSVELKRFNLTLNHKKTEILKLPMASNEHWVRKINTFVFVNEDKALKINEVRSYLDIGVN